WMDKILAREGRRRIWPRGFASAIAIHAAGRRKAPRRDRASFARHPTFVGPTCGELRQLQGWAWTGLRVEPPDAILVRTIRASRRCRQDEAPGRALEVVAKRGGMGHRQRAAAIGKIAT